MYDCRVGKTSISRLLHSQRGEALIRIIRFEDIDQITFASEEHCAKMSLDGYDFFPSLQCSNESQVIGFVVLFCFLSFCFFPQCGSKEYRPFGFAKNQVGFYYQGLICPPFS